MTVMVMMTLVVMVHSAKWANVSKPGFLSTFLPCNFSTGPGMAPETNNNSQDDFAFVLHFAVFFSKKVFSVFQHMQMLAGMSDCQTDSEEGAKLQNIQNDDQADCNGDDDYQILLMVESAILYIS